LPTGRGVRKLGAMRRSTARKRAKPADVPGYIAAAPARARPMLRELRRIVRRAVPKATEKISYGIPYYHYHARLAYFAAFTGHVSFYIMGRTKTAFARDTAKYRTSAATMRFPLGSKVPAALLTRILRARKREIDRSE